MPHLQLFVIDHCHQLHTYTTHDDAVTVADIHQFYDLPQNSCLTHSNRRLPPYTHLTAHHHNDITLHCTTRLLGGKGGFGSLLRSTSRKKNEKTNTGAMRDLSGRRLRVVQAEQALNAATSTNSRTTSVNRTELHDKFRAINAGVKLDSDKKPCKFGTDCKYKYKCKYSHPAPPDATTSKSTLAAADDSKYNDSDDDSGSDTKYKQQLRNVIVSSSNAHKRQRVDHTTSSSHTDDYSNTINRILHNNDSESDDSDSDSEQAEQADESKYDQAEDPAKATYMTDKHKQHNSDNFLDIPDFQPVNSTPAQNNTVTTDVKPTAETRDDRKQSEQPSASPFASIDLSNVTNASELEQYGLQHLKHELEQQRLKAGGTLAERAKRLFMFKSLTYAELPDKVKAK